MWKVWRQILLAVFKLLFYREQTFFVCMYKHIVNVNMLLSGINIARPVF